MAFRVLGLDMVGPVPKAPGGFKYLFMAINKFTKWIEVFPMVTYSAEQAAKFIQDIMYQFVVMNRTPQTWAPPSPGTPSGISVKTQGLRSATCHGHIQLLYLQQWKFPKSSSCYYTELHQLQPHGYTNCRYHTRLIATCQNYHI